MRKTKFLFGVIAALLISTASATTISEEKITVDLETNEVNVEIDIEELTTNSFNWRTTHPVRNLENSFAGESRACNVEELTVGAEINCDTDLKNNFSVKLSYTTSGLISSRGNIKTFSYSQSIYRPIKNYSFTVILPEGTGLVDDSNITAPAVQPTSGELGSQEGRRFSVTWNTNPELGDTARFQVIFENLDNQSNTVYETMPYLLGSLLIAGIIYVVYKRKTELEVSSVLDELDSDEEMILEMLRENKGEMLQKDIVDKSEYSKAKISGVVGQLEEKEIVSKEKDGRSNKVTLKEKFI